MPGVVLKAQVPQQGQVQQQNIEVSDSELESFANIMQEAQNVQREAQMVIRNSIKENSNMEMQRFQEISKAQQKGGEVNMSQEEKEAYSGIQKVIKEEQQKMDKKMASILEDHEMDRQRYMEINQALRRDKELLSRLKQIMSQQGQQ